MKWNELEQARMKWNELEQARTSWNELEPSGMSQNQLEQAGTRWSYQRLELERVRVVSCNGSCQLLPYTSERKSEANLQ